MGSALEITNSLTCSYKSIEYCYGKNMQASIGKLYLSCSHQAKMVELPEEYDWSSHKGYIEYRGDSRIDKDQVNKVFGVKAKEYR